MIEEPREAVTIAVATLARELGCAMAEITLAEARPVTWPNSALGCPRPGVMYTQVITPGYQIRLVRGQQEYLLHTDRGQRAVRCPDSGIMHDVGAGE